MLDFSFWTFSMIVGSFTARRLFRMTNKRYRCPSFVMLSNAKHPTDMKLAHKKGRLDTARNS